MLERVVILQWKISEKRPIIVLVPESNFALRAIFSVTKNNRVKKVAKGKGRKGMGRKGKERKGKEFAPESFS